MYLYVRSAEDGWLHQAYIKASNTDANDVFGSSVALSHAGDTLAVGAPGEDSTATGINGDQSINTMVTDRGIYQTNAGAVYLLQRADQTWTQEAYIKPAHSGLSLGFGNSVSLSADGRRLAVGATGDLSFATGINGDATDYDLNDVTGERINSRSGSAFIFNNGAAGWYQEAYIKASNPDRFDEFGHAVALSADGLTLAVSTTREASNAKGINGDQTDNSHSNTGAVYVYTIGSAGWAERAYVKPANTRGGDRFGNEVALSEDGATMAVGAYRDASAATGVNGDRDDSSALSAGAVYLY